MRASRETSAREISLGDDALDWRVSAVNDRDGSYVGPLVTLRVIAKRVELADNLEKNLKRDVETVSSASAEMESTAEAMAPTSEETTRQSTAVVAASESATSNVRGRMTGTRFP